MSPQGIARLIGVAIVIFVVVIMAASGTYVVHPGYRGVEVTMGKVSAAFKPEGFGMKTPFATAIFPVSIRQQTAEDKAECYSSDLQQVVVELRVLFRIPEASVVKLFQGCGGDAFDSLVATIKQQKGRLDILFANAGGGEFLPLEQVTEAHFDKYFGINVKGRLFTVQKALPLMPAGGAIVINGSMVSIKGMPAFGV
jgi:hypothetical protein